MPFLEVLSFFTSYMLLIGDILPQGQA